MHQECYSGFYYIVYSTGMLQQFLLFFACPRNTAAVFNCPVYLSGILQRFLLSCVLNRNAAAVFALFCRQQEYCSSFCYFCYLVGKILMGFQDVAFLSPRASFALHFLKTVVEVKASGPPHVLILWLGCRQGHAPCKILPLLHMS